ncbi:Down syndrome cell adhesion molecule-like protein 1 homolog isoform X1 [Schistocerca cancellata]|uniref:Down syndrome cell adhesion molecule-like protein 1 homolog isoform X1 n=1 Tax=Schistocerca cancellata TaxID=274614 RepID=UPI0021172D0C|nr:Down syndrome cell adhesion molecule-like protein 1 homolog isoform X1 [Schistocerca cancellata]
MQDERVVAGTTVTFNCYVTGYPISSIYWEKDGRPLIDTHRQTVFSNGTLLIRDIRKVDDEGGYVCVASNPDGDTARRKMNVQVMEAPEIDPILVKSNLQRGMRIHLTCIISKGDFPVSIRWLKDGKAIPHGQGITEKTIDDYSSTLSFNGLAVNHSGNYTCQASNAAAITNYTVPIIVNVPPSWQTEPNDTEVVLGSSLMVDCAADGSPMPRIQWKKESPIPVSPFQDIHRTENFKVLENGSLWIQDVLLEDKGYYVCEANSGIGVTLNKGIYITVHVPARFSTAFHNVTARKGSTAILDCVADGDKPLEIKWHHANRLLRPDHVKMDVKEEKLDFGLRSKLTIKHVHRDDSALFGCLASNKYGSDRMEFHLIVQENPEPPFNVRLINFSSRTANISWEMPYDGNSPIHTFIIQIKNVSGSWENSRRAAVSGTQKKASVIELHPAHSYQLRVLAENSVGVSNASDVVSVTTTEEVPGGPPRDIQIKVRNSEALLITWKPPEIHLQHGEITGYHVGYRVRNSTDPFHFKTYEVIPGTDLQITLSNLRKFTEYNIVVQAYNRAGAGPRSEEYIASTDEDVPGAPPTDVQCTALSAYSILVLWSPPPAKEINGILVGYRVVYHALSNWDDMITMDEHTTIENKLELLDLVPFCNYSIEVKAFTRKGDGVPSRPIFCRTQEDVPGEPEDIKALVMDSRTILLSWRAPKYPNGRIKKYKVYMRSIDGVGLDRDQYDLPSEQTYYSISHLETHHRYEFWVTAFTIVGEGNPSRRVVQAPTNHVPARIASFSESMTVAWKEELRLPCLTVGQPAPILHWTKNGKTVQGNRHVQINSEGTVYISSVQNTDAGNYSCSAENVFGKEEIVYSVSVQESRSKGIPSAPTDFQASSHSTSTISLTWLPPPSRGSTVKGYYLHFKREFGEWEKIKIPAHESHFTLKNLQCGTRHQFYLQAFNQLGQSSPTPTISQRTQGSAPVAPNIFDLIHVNSTSISLNVSSWGDGGCPITSFVVEYKLKHGVDWTLVSNNVKFDQTEFLVLDLNPETWYTLRMTAHNSAGSTIYKYDFVTLTHSGAIVAPELIVHSGYGQGSLLNDLGIIIPTVAALVIIVVSGAGFFLYMRKKQEMFQANKYGEKPSEIGLVPDVGKVGGCESDTTAGGSNGCSGMMSSSPHESVCLPTPMRVSLGRRQDISPYATFQVPNSMGSEGAVEGVPLTMDHCSQGQPLEGVNVDIYKCGSSADSVYTKICKTSQYDDDAVDWIPLHSLYKSHRY